MSAVCLASDLASLEVKQLQGLTLYGQGGKNIGETSGLILGETGNIDRFIVDVGGCLGLGEKPVALSSAEVFIMENAETEELRAFLQPTEESLENLPAYEG